VGSNGQFVGQGNSRTSNVINNHSFQNQHNNSTQIANTTNIQSGSTRAGGSQNRAIISKSPGVVSRAHRV